MMSAFHFRSFSYFDYSRTWKIKSIKMDFTISDGNISKLKKSNFFHCIHFVVSLLKNIARCRFPSFICQAANISAGKNLPKWVRPKGNRTYDLRLLTHLRPTTNALDYSRNCGSPFWNLY